MNKNLIFIFTVLILILTACQENPTEVSPSREGEPFELFLTSDRELTGADLKDYELEDIPLAEKPFFKTEDIDNYYWEGHAINLKENAYKALLLIFSDNLPLTGLPFVVVSHGERIYAGAFWTPISSVSFDGVTILQPMDPSGWPLYITLGYPTEEFYTGEDPRNDPRLKHALEDANLLWDGETTE